MTRADLKHCGKMPDASDGLSRSVREGRKKPDILLRVWKEWDLCYTSLEQNSFTVDSATFSSVEKVALVVQATSIVFEVAVSKALLALNFSTLLLKCLMVRLGS